MSPLCNLIQLPLHVLLHVVDAKPLGHVALSAWQKQISKIGPVRRWKPLKNTTSEVTHSRLTSKKRCHWIYFLALSAGPFLGPQIEHLCYLRMERRSHFWCRQAALILGRAFGLNNDFSFSIPALASANRTLSIQRGSRIFTIVSHEDIIMIMKSWTSSMWLLKPKNNFYSCLRPHSFHLLHVVWCKAAWARRAVCLTETNQQDRVKALEEHNI